MMSSMVAIAFQSVLLTFGMPAPALPDHAQTIGTAQRLPGVPAADARIAPAIAEWKRLRQSDSFAFDAYARFLLAHPGWPGEDAMRNTAEKAIRPDGAMQGLVTAFFDRFAPRTATGRLRYAEALIAVQRRPEAEVQARAAWTRAGLSPTDEALLTARFGGILTPADHDKRMDALLWAGATTAAARQLAWTSPGMRALFDARLAYRTRAPDASAKGSAVAALGANDAGYLADRARWLAATMQLPAARATLASRRPLAVPPAAPEAWMELLVAQARNAGNDGQWQTAWAIASQLDDIYAPGVDVAAQSYGERDEYTNLAWLAGTTALNKLGRPANAIGMFDRYARGSRTPQVQSKGLYWAGRAAEAAGQRALADGYYARAAEYADYFYGQLATERLGRRILPPPVATVAVDPNARAAYFNREIVRAAQWLGATGQRQDQTYFLRQIAADATTDTDHQFGHELARMLGRPDLGVMVGRSARTNGHNDYVASGFPTTPVPPAHSVRWTMIHAITRQESQFDRTAVSHAGARGMMQLMPATAREQAGKMGLGYSLDNLTGDPMYNIMLGSAYFQRMVDYFGGSLPLAVAAYNAGAGNVNKWLRANGDPRTGSVDWLTWIEAIPYTETRGYVQRVLENAVVYDAINPNGRMTQSEAPLSRLIGKSRPG